MLLVAADYFDQKKPVKDLVELILQIPSLLRKQISLFMELCLSIVRSGSRRLLLLDQQICVTHVSGVTREKLLKGECPFKNSSSSQKSKKILFFPTEFHTKVSVFEKLHKLINNCKQFYAKRKLSQGQNRISVFFCKLSQADKDLEKAQIL